MAKGKKQKKQSKAKGGTKAARKPVAKKAAKKAVAKKSAGNGLPRPSSKAFGKAGKALDGVRVLDFTHVQSGPTCTQLLAWFGADVIKVERPGVGDITRGQLVDVKGADSLYFTMLNHTTRSITIDSKNPKGKNILERLIKHCDVLVENFAPGALDRMGLTWEHINKLNPRMIVASIKGFGPGPFEDLLALGVLGVDRDRALVAVQHGEVEAVLPLHVAQLRAGDVAHTGTLHLDAIGAQIAQ